jgi:predicted aspartyl protease
LYQYKQAAAACSDILSSYGEQLDSTKIKAYQNTHDLFTALSDVPSQTMRTTKDETIAAHRNKFNHLMVPVKTHSIAADFIFDSGAGLSTISESYAKKMNLRTVEGSVSVGSATTINVTSKLAVADSLFVGGIEFRNVVFLVLPDEKLSIPQVGLVINGIIGFPVMYQMGEIHMHKDGTIFVPRVPQDRHLNNLLLDNQVPIIAANSDNDTLLFNMDTGAKTTEFSKKYYDIHKASVEKNGRKMTRHFGGAGGITKLEIYELPAVTLTIGTQRAHLKKVPVMLSDHKFTKNTDGNLGQDVITQFNEMVLNFKYMYVDFGAAD